MCARSSSAARLRLPTSRPKSAPNSKPEGRNERSGREASVRGFTPGQVWAAGGALGAGSPLLSASDVAQRRVSAASRLFSTGFWASVRARQHARGTVPGGGVSGGRNQRRRDESRRGKHE